MSLSPREHRAPEPLKPAVVGDVAARGNAAPEECGAKRRIGPVPHTCLLVRGHVEAHRCAHNISWNEPHVRLPYKDPDADD